MILNKLKHNGIDVSIITSVLFVLAAVSMFLPKTAELVSAPENGTQFFNAIYEKICGGSLSVQTQVISLLLFLAEVMLIVLMNFNHKLLEAKSIFFLLVFTLVGFSYVPFNTLLPEQVANIFITLGFIRLLYSHGVDKAEYMVFDTGLFFGTAALFCIPAACMLIIGLIAMFVFRPYKLSEFSAYLTGFITPVLFGFSGYYISESTLQPVLDCYIKVFASPRPYIVTEEKIVFFALYFIMVGIASVFLLQEYPKYNLFSARTYKMFFVLFITVSVLAVSPYFPLQTLRMTVMPLTMLYVTVFYGLSFKRSAYPEIIFMVFFVIYAGINVLWYVL